MDFWTMLISKGGFFVVGAMQSIFRAYLLNLFIAKISPSLSFSWAELVFILNFTPPIHPTESKKMVQYSKT